MTFETSIEIFINDFVKELKIGNASLFAGAGLSKGAGYVNWSELLEEIATELGLDINKEHDLISLAQYHFNENRNRTKINKKILEEFTEGVEETENHKILARLPFSSIWTTNYDCLIEKSLEHQNKIVDVKHQEKQLLNHKPKRDVVLYKMHGDVNHSADAILTKEDYERYHQTHEGFITALNGELTTKTFLFIGFSFTDPNLDYILSRLHHKYGSDKKQHYCFIKKHILGDYNNPDQIIFDYNSTKQKLFINDLTRFGIKSLVVENYSAITAILSEIEKRYKKGTIFISGSAEEYGLLEREQAKGFIHLLSKRLIENDFRLINGFGWGVGSSVINGALEAIYQKPNKYSEDQLILKPFPQFKTGNMELKDLWTQYRQKMISLAGISIFIFGNKFDPEKNIIEANGVIQEFEIGHSQGCVPIPIAFTGYASKSIYDKVLQNPEKFYTNPDKILPLLKEVVEKPEDIGQTVEKIITIIKSLT